MQHGDQIGSPGWAARGTRSMKAAIVFAQGRAGLRPDRFPIVGATACSSDSSRQFGVIMGVQEFVGLFRARPAEEVSYNSSMAGFS